MRKPEIKAAVETATNVIKEVYADQEIFDILLEEIESINDGENWSITISFKRKIPQDIPVPFTALMENRVETKFKRVIIDKSSLELIEMNHREFKNE